MTKHDRARHCRALKAKIGPHVDEAAELEALSDAIRGLQSKEIFISFGKSCCFFSKETWSW